MVRRLEMIQVVEDLRQTFVEPWPLTKPAFFWVCFLRRRQIVTISIGDHRIIEFKTSSRHLGGNVKKEEDEQRLSQN